MSNKVSTHFWVIWEYEPLKYDGPSPVDTFYNKDLAVEDLKWYRSQLSDAGEKENHRYELREYKV